MSDKRIPLDYETAIGYLPEGGEIHTFRGGPGILLGADWGRDGLLEAIRQCGAEVAGPVAQSMKHGLVLFDKTGPLFIETTGRTDEGDGPETD